MPSCYSEYRATPDGLMDVEVFKDLARRFDRTLRARGQQAVLLVDQSSCHVTSITGLTNLMVHKLLPGSATLQPFEICIFMLTKAFYRRDLLRYYIANTVEGKLLIVTPRRALQMVKHAWSRVSAQAIHKCWVHSGLLVDFAHYGSEPGSTVDDPENDIPLVELQQLIGRLNDCGDVSAADYVTVDDKLETCAHWDLASNFEGKQSDGNMKEENVDDSGPLVELRNAVEGVTVVITFLEQLGEAQHLPALWDVLRTLEEKYLQRQRKATASTVT